jgi:uncharacterized protein YjdB
MALARLGLPTLSIGATLACTGCALLDLDLNGGAHVTEVKLADDPAFMLAIDDTRPLALTLVYDDGFEETAPSDRVTWALANPQVAAIDGNHQLRARAIGTTALTGGYGGRSATAMVLVTDVPQQLEIMASNRSCAVGQRLSYGLLLRYQHGSTEDATARAAWQSDQPTIASVAAGTVTGLAVGDTQIEAQLGALMTSASVHVSAAIAVHVDVLPAALQLAVGGMQELRTSALYSDGNTLDITQLAQWQSSLPSLASVAPDGTVTALAAGRVTITASRDGAAGTANLTIVAAP